MYHNIAKFFYQGDYMKKKADFFMKIFNIQNVCEKKTFLNCKFKMFKKLPNTFFKNICMFFYRETLIFFAWKLNPYKEVATSQAFLCTLVLYLRRKSQSRCPPFIFISDEHIVKQSKKKYVTNNIYYVNWYTKLFYIFYIVGKNRFSLKIGHNWHGVNIDGMCTVVHNVHCTAYLY